MVTYQFSSNSIANGVFSKDATLERMVNHYTEKKQFLKMIDAAIKVERSKIDCSDRLWITDHSDKFKIVISATKSTSPYRSTLFPEYSSSILVENTAREVEILVVNTPVARHPFIVRDLSFGRKLYNTLLEKYYDEQNRDFQHDLSLKDIDTLIHKGSLEFEESSEFESYTLQADYNGHKLTIKSTKGRSFIHFGPNYYQNAFYEDIEHRHEDTPICLPSPREMFKHLRKKYITQK